MTFSHVLSTPTEPLPLNINRFVDLIKSTTTQNRHPEIAKCSLRVSRVMSNNQSQSTAKSLAISESQIFFYPFALHFLVDFLSLAFSPSLALLLSSSLEINFCFSCSMAFMPEKISLQKIVIAHKQRQQLSK